MQKSVTQVPKTQPKDEPYSYEENGNRIQYPPPAPPK